MADQLVTQLVEVFKAFMEACCSTIELPQQFKRKWSIFSYLLNNYPEKSQKLVEYSKKCVNYEMEKQFIEDNLKNVDLQLTINHQNQLSPNKKVKQLKRVEGTSSQVQKSSYPTQQFKENLSELLQLAVEQMKRGSEKFVTNERCRKPSEFYKESFIVSGDVIKKIDANQLRQKILVQKKPTQVKVSSKIQYPSSKSK